MADKVDVLAVLRRVSRHVPNEDFVEFDDALHAVAELIEAATPFAKLECLGASIESSPDDAVAIITIGTIKRVRAALARVEGTP